MKRKAIERIKPKKPEGKGLQQTCGRDGTDERICTED